MGGEGDVVAVDKTKCDKSWTQSRYNSFIKSALRKASTRWPPKFNTLNAAKRGKRINKATGRVAEHYECGICHNEFPAKEVAVDHINPIIDELGFTTWDSVIENMFCDSDNLQVLCSACHTEKTNAEKALRKITKG